MLSSILVPLDGSVRSAKALPLAVQLGKSSGAELHIVHIVSTPGATLAGPAGAARRTGSQRAFAEAAVRCPEGKASPRGRVPFRVHSSVRQGSVVPVVLEEVRTRGADLILMTTDARSGLGRAAPDSVAAELLRQGVGPLLLIPPSFGSAASVSRFRRILVGLDGSSLSEEILPPVSALADVLPAELVLLHLTPMPDLRTTALVRALARQGVRHYLESLAQRMQSTDRRISIRVAEGTAATRISTVALELGASLIALTTHGWSGHGSVPLGRVASGTIQRSVVPVLLMRPGTLAPARPDAWDRN
jgi:nucleotide-binding universal stress UspA family protein